ncbi:MAG: RibD family protein [Candidatus Thermoplasmatota archaeon]|nr:RibD family protein [Candidatus Thermoplasmatota archaeon]
MLPKVIIHNATSADGRITGFDVDMGAYYGLVSKFKENCTLCGSETILASPDGAKVDGAEALEKWEPDPKDKKPILAVVDTRGRIKCWHYLRTCGFWRDAIAICSKTTQKEHIEYLKKCSVKIIIAGIEKADMRKALLALNEKYAIKRIRVDSGGTLNGILIREGLADEFSILVHPALVGDAGGKSVFNPPVPGSPERIKLVSMEKIDGGLVWLRYKAIKK